MSSISWDGVTLTVDSTGGPTIRVRANNSDEIEFSTNGMTFNTNPVSVGITPTGGGGFPISAATPETINFIEGTTVDIQGFRQSTFTELTSLNLTNAVLDPHAFGGMNVTDLSKVTMLDLTGASLGNTSFFTADLSSLTNLDLSNVASIADNSFASTTFGTGTTVCVAQGVSFSSNVFLLITDGASDLAALDGASSDGSTITFADTSTFDLTAGNYGDGCPQPPPVVLSPGKIQEIIAAPSQADQYSGQTVIVVLSSFDLGAFFADGSYAILINALLNAGASVQIYISGF